IVITLAIIDLMGLRLSTAGIAAFLMLIGYSVDTDILLTTRLVKRTEGTVFERLMGAMSTGLTMSATTIAVVTLALIFSQSDTIRQIMIILLIGLIVDLINTWIQNVGILRIYLARKQK
ncbi:MAG: protein translocase subunit SecF, partial [Nanoarchaeota archaeon]|nr:protein translocase subunit SecF [Nanoarchaeota archaeon]